MTPRKCACGPYGQSLHPVDLLLPDWTAGVSEVSRFSCMKFLGVPWGLRLGDYTQVPGQGLNKVAEMAIVTPIVEPKSLLPWNIKSAMPEASA